MAARKVQKSLIELLPEKFPWRGAVTDERNSKLMLPQLPAGEHELMIPYNFQRALLKLVEGRHRGTQAAFCLALFISYMLTIAVVFLSVANSELGTFLFFSSFFMPLIMIICFTSLKPTNIQVGAQGLRYHWLSTAGLSSTPWLPWTSVEFVSSTVHNLIIFWGNEHTIDIHIALSTIPRRWHRWLAVFLAYSWGGNLRGDILKIRISAKAITHDADIADFLNALRFFLPKDKIDDSLLELQNSLGSLTFTKIWLDDFDKTRNQIRPLQAGDRVAGGRYIIKERIGAGGQATTYKAEKNIDKAANSETEPAIIVLKEFVLPIRGGIEIKRRALENVEHEARLLRQLSHPNIVKLLDVFCTSQRAYLAMEYINGESLRRMVQAGGTFSEERVINLAVQMCDILAFLHKQVPPVVHRDFTPDNLLLTEDDSLCLIDFNVAEQLESESTKTVVGKHCYIPPEQFRGHATTQSDIYALGCTMFWLLTGEDPEPISTAHPRSIRPDVSMELDDIVARATRVDESSRFKDVSEVFQALHHLINLRESSNKGAANHDRDSTSQPEVQPGLLHS